MIKNLAEHFLRSEKCEISTIFVKRFVSTPIPQNQNLVLRPI